MFVLIFRICSICTEKIYFKNINNVSKIAEGSGNVRFLQRVYVDTLTIQHVNDVYKIDVVNYCSTVFIH